jgi:thioredoxin-like negative regulator of GroEL
VPRDDFNYKVALASGSRSLEAGQLGKAEEQFRYATKRCPECGGGYRGLAKVLVETGNRPAALEILREGSQTLAKANNRAEAIELLRDAVQLAPEDLGLHRRYAAALANAGASQDAVGEYDRFIGVVLGRGDTERARTELAYASSTLGALPGLARIAERIESQRSAPRAASPQAGTRPPEAKPPSPQAQAVREPAHVAPPSAPRALRDEPASGRPAAEPQAGRGPTGNGDAQARALQLEATAQELLARRDPRASAAALEAARALLSQGQQLAAADILLQVVALGIPDRDAQRLLVDVARALGRGELARDKCALLAEALRLDGRPDAAAELERLAAG